MSRLLRTPSPDEPATFAGTITDIIAGISITVFLIGAGLWIGVFAQ
ncbi:hypothetical protein C7441_112128 [Pseudaminobacter salicylatoxidans]|uniref:Uncharacterized protein n=1 Tax=Pseudaminobacter salicylatoxidans TaxID=93369 RepID=A0A316BZS7_PSESE|nr:hypothetical protein [Pseudaminobacter salicylatoxidans]PWJ80586.1 hypothetical protein C7441_112128 [Pseudaminobacter salicylatoxidans]